MKLPVELRLQVYSYLLHASGSNTPRRALPKLRKKVQKVVNVASATGDGIIAVRKPYNCLPIAHSQSALPSITFLRACHQLRSEGLREIYKHNVFEVVAHTQRRPGQLIFELPGFLRLEPVRELRLITHSEVSRFQSCFAYDIFRNLTSLRKISIAMKTTTPGHGMDFASCLETMNLALWIPKHVDVDFVELNEAVRLRVQGV